MIVVNGILVESPSVNAIEENGLHTTGPPPRAKSRAAAESLVIRVSGVDRQIRSATASCNGFHSARATSCG